MASNAAIQQYVNASADPALAVYANNTQGVPAVSGNTSVYITNVNEYVVNHITSGGAPAGNTTEVQFNFNGTMDGDEGLTYNPTTDSLTVTGNLTAGNVLTNNLKYANGTNWNFDSSYSNSNVFSYLPTYVGDLNPGTVEAQHFIGNGSQLTHLPAANLVGSVPVAAVANSVAGANVTGTVASATVASSANAVAGANVTGTVSSATNATNATFAGTVTTAAQPNITSIGTLSNFTSQGTVNFISASNVSLGAVGNIHITGGTNGQVLTATGTPGVVQWATPSSSTLQDVTTNGATTTVAINITNATTSSGYSSGALKVSGGVGVGGNLNAHGNISTTETVFSGNLASYGPLTVPKFVGRDTGLYYIQGALQNIQETGSADWVAYGDQSDDANGWMDMGFTGTGFNDPAYSITKASDGYIICQGMADVNGSPQGGNLVIATGEKGANADIVFAVGGFSADNEIARIDHDALTFFVGGHAYGSTIDNPTPLVANLDVNGDTELRGNLKVTKRSDLGSAANVYITGGTAGQVLSTDGAGNLSWTTVSGGGGVPAGSGTTSYNDVWLLSDKGANALFWTSYSLTGNLSAMFSGADVTGLSSQAVYGKQFTEGTKTLIINDATIQTNNYGIVIEFPASPSVGDTFSTPVTGSTGVGKVIFKPASGQKAYVLASGGGGGVAVGTGTTYIGAYIDATTFGAQPVTWVYAGSISGTPTWYQLYF